MRLLNLGPETIIDRKDLPDEIKQSFPTNIDPDFVLDGKVNTELLKKYNLAMSAKGHFFKRDERSIFNIKVEEVYNERKQRKNESLRQKQIEEDIRSILKERGVEV